MHTSRNFSQSIPRLGMIDLIMPIVIIAILIAILLPAIMHARRTAQETAARDSTNATAAQTPQAMPGNQTTMKSPHSLLSDSNFALAIVAACFAAIAWYYKQLQEQFTLRNELAVIEVLSDGMDRTRKELAAAVKLSHQSIRIIPGAFTDALASLVSKGSLVIVQGKFKIAPKSK